MLDETLLVHTAREPSATTVLCPPRSIMPQRYFKIGASWGGYGSLVTPAYPTRVRLAVPWTETGFILRYHVGLEDPADLIADLEAGFQRLHQMA